MVSSAPSQLVMRLVLVLLTACVTAATTTTASTVVLRHDGCADALNLLVLLLDLLRVGLGVRVHPRLAVLESVHDLLLLVGVHLLTEALVVAGAFRGAAHRVHVAVEGVLSVDTLLDLLVLIGKLLGLLNHLLDLLLCQAALVVGDRDLLALACALVLSADVQDAVGVDLKGDLDLGLATRGRGDATELELAEQVVVLGHRPLALKHLNVHGRLVVLVGGEDLRLLGRDHRVAADELGHHTTHRLDAQRQRGHVEQQEVLATLAAEDSSLHSGAIGHRLIGVDAAVWLLAVEEVLDELLHLWDARGAADEHDLVNLVLLQARVLEDLLDRAQRVFEEVVVDLLEAGAGQRLGEVDAVVKSLDLEPGLVRGAQRTLGLLDLTAQLLDRALVLGHVLVVLLLEDLHEVLHHALIEVLAAQVGVAIRGNNLEYAVVDCEQRHIEGATAEVVDKDVLLGLLVKAVGDGSRCGLVDDAEHIHAGDGASVLGGLALGIVEVRRDGDHGVLHLLAEVVLGNFPHLRQNHRRHLLRGHDLLLALDLDSDHGLAVLVGDLVGQKLDVLLHSGVLETPTNQPFHVEERLRRVDRRLILRRLANQPLIVGEGDVGWGDPVTLIIRDDLHAAILVDAHARVRRSKVNANHGPI